MAQVTGMFPGAGHITGRGPALLDCRFFTIQGRAGVLDLDTVAGMGGEIMPGAAAAGTGITGMGTEDTGILMEDITGGIMEEIHTPAIGDITNMSRTFIREENTE